MSIWTNLFSSGVDKIVDSVADGMDNLFTSDEERLKMQNMLAKIKAEARHKDKEIEIQYEAEITKRNADDQKSGNFLTKSARPIFLYWLMFIISTMVFGGLYGIVIDEGYVELVKVLAVASVTFFFGSKGMEAYKHGRVL